MYDIFEVFADGTEKRFAVALTEKEYKKRGRNIWHTRKHVDGFVAIVVRYKDGVRVNILGDDSVVRTDREIILERQAN